MSHSKKSNKGVLSDHKRVGKVFKPPLTHLGRFEETNWLQYTMPELLWIALLLEKCGLRNGVDLCLELALEAQKLEDGDSKCWFAATSSYSALTGENKNILRKKLSGYSKLKYIQDALEPLIHFYPKCPLSFLFEDEDMNESMGSRELSSFKEILSSMYSKRDRLPILVQTQGVYIALVSQKLRITKDSAMANLEAVLDYPNSEESLRIGATVCATCNMLIGELPEEGAKEWPNYFWQRGFELEDCEYQLPYDLDHE